MTQPMMTVLGAARALVVPFDAEEAQGLTSSFLGGSPLREVFAVIQRIGLRDFALLERGPDMIRVVVGGVAVATGGGGSVVRVPADSIAAHREDELPHSVVRVSIADHLVLAWEPGDGLTTAPPLVTPSNRGEPQSSKPPRPKSEVPESERTPAATAPEPPGPVIEASSEKDLDRPDDADVVPPPPEPAPPLEVEPDEESEPPGDVEPLPQRPPSHQDVTYVRPPARGPQGDNADITVHEAVESEALATPNEPGGVDGLPPPVVGDRRQDISPPTHVGQEPPPSAAGGSGLITGVPGMTGEPQPRSSDPVRTSGREQARGPGGRAREPRVERGESDGHTVAAGELRAKVAAAKAGRTDSGVTSQLCPNGHANPPSTPQCRSCGESLTGQPVVHVPRPVVARLEFVGGLLPPVEVDRTQIIGRRPTARDDQPGLQPGLVTIPDGDREVSGSHLELRVHGWTLDVIDLGSTNGTWIQLPGEEERRMRPDEPEMVRVGTRIRLADVASFTVVAPR